MARTQESSAVAAVTVSYGSDAVLPSFLRSLESSTTGPAPSVVVVDNRPDTGSASRIAAENGARYLAFENRGYGAAINAGVAALDTTARWVLISNPDVVLGERAIDLLVAAGEADAAIGAVGPAILNSDGSIYPSARAVPSIRIGVGHALFGNVWKGNPWSRRYHLGTSATPRDAGWLSGACLLVRREAFERVGGFDEAYFMYFEDVDLGMRLTRAGFRNRYEPHARVTHTGAHSTASHNEAMIDAHHRSAARFLSSRYPHGWQAPIRWTLRTGLRIRSAFVRARARSVDSTGPHTH